MLTAHSACLDGQLFSQFLAQAVLTKRSLTSKVVTTFKRSNMNGIDLTEAEMDQPDMTESQLDQAKVFRSVWQALNLTKAVFWFLRKMKKLLM
jgi:uncharacterized protein YjbI with pentapeptide repeats